MGDEKGEIRNGSEADMPGGRKGREWTSLDWGSRHGDRDQIKTPGTSCSGEFYTEKWNQSPKLIPIFFAVTTS